jgi:hypothetical protein
VLENQLSAPAQIIDKRLDANRSVFQEASTGKACGIIRVIEHEQEPMAVSAGLGVN